MGVLKTRRTGGGFPVGTSKSRDVSLAAEFVIVSPYVFETGHNSPCLP